MSYVDGIVMAVPTAKKDEFIKYAESTNPYWKGKGVKRILYVWGDEIMEGKQTDFRMAVQAKEDESIVLCTYEWPDKETRNAAHQEMRSGNVENYPKDPPPFDGSRMIFGGFTPVMDC